MKILICKIFLRKFIYDVTRIITVDCHDNYSDIQQNSTCKAGSVQKQKMHMELMTPEKGASAVGILWQGAGIWQVSRFPEKVYKSRSPAEKCRSLRQIKLNSSFSGHQAFRTPAFNGRRPIQKGNVIDTYCCSIRTALALSAVVIRRRMM